MGSAGLEDLLPLSPLQEGLLFHALYDGDDRETCGDGHAGSAAAETTTAAAATDVYAVQLVLRLAGAVDATRLRAAGEALLRRHANLRAGFRFGRSGKPVQVVPRHVELPWCEVDLRGDRLAELVAAERARRFDLARPPALRLVLVRLGDADETAAGGADPDNGPATHALVLTSHHILFDGWSTPLLVRELLQLHAAGGDEAALPPVASYHDYLGWLLDRDHDAARAAWDRALEGLAAPTRLAPAAAATAGAPGEHAAVLSAERTAELTDAARRAGVTLNTLLQGAWAMVLAAVTGRDDVVFGTTVAARPAELSGVEQMVGLLVNTVPVRAQVRPAEPVVEALARLQREQAELWDHHHLGLAEIQRRAGLGQLFDTLLVFENHPREPDGDPAGELRVTGVEAHDATHYPLTVVATPGSTLRLALHHRTDAVTPADAARLAERLQRVLDAVAADPDRPVAACSPVSADETAELLEWGDGGDHRPVPAADLPSLFGAQAARTPHAAAVRSAGRELTYAELEARANRLAHRLAERGVGPESVVALALGRSPEHVAAFLAVQKAGGACLPLDLDHPADRLASVLADARPALVLTSATSADRLPSDAAGASVQLDELDAADGDDPGPPPLDGDTERPAYLVYTSGSTGQPKGVVVTHAGIPSLVATARRRLGVGPGSRVGQFAALGFDIAVWELCMALLSGGCLVIVPAVRRTDVDALLALAVDERLDVLALPPSLLAAVPTDAALPAGLTLLVGAEPVPAELVRRWSRRVRLVVAYGVTEATVNQTLWIVPPGWDGRSVPVGRPDPGTRAYVLGSGLQPQPAGAVGELYVGGDGVARGYLGQPALTASRFVADPFGPPGSRMYRTGDLARWTDDGELELLGRADDQIQIRGFRVEPGEIESALLRQPEVAAAAVVARDRGGAGGTQLVGYAVPAPGSRVETEPLRRRLAAELPDHLVPAAIVELSALPHTPTGKLDRAALPDSGPAGGGSGGAPRTPTEETLARLIGEVLDVAEVGVDDDVFALGGDSISSIVLVSRARREGLGLTPRAVFEHRTVARLAAAATAIAVEPPSGDADDEVGRVPLTPIVAWLREHDGVIDGHNQSMVLEVPASTDEAELAGALQAVLDHHAMLRARLVRSADGWELDVPPPGAVDAGGCLSRVDTAGLDGDALAAEIDAQSSAAASRLDPDAGVMVQAAWFDHGGERPGRLALVIHHLAVDGVSWRILVPDLAAAWEAVAASRTPELEPVPTPFRRWAHQLVEEAHRPGREAELPLWRETLVPDDPPLSPVSLDRDRDTAATTGHLTRTLPPERTAPLLTDVPAAFHAEINDVLLTALALTVADWRRRRGRAGDAGHAVLVNLEGHGREQVVTGVDLSRTVGWFTSTFPVRLDPGPVDLADALDGGAAAGDAIKHIKEQLRALPDKGIGFGLLRYLNERTAAELAPLRWPQIGFNYLGRFATASGQRRSSDRIAPLHQTLSGAADDAMPAAYVLEINAITRDHDTGPELSVTWSFPPAVLADDEVAAIADGWFAALDALTRHARTPGAGGHSPSDLLVALSQDEIDELEGGFAHRGAR